MKNETARREIESLDYYLQNHTDDYSEESHMAMMMAIKALEQEPCEDAISRDMALKECHDIVVDGERYRVIQEETLLGLPSVNPTKTGHWIPVYQGDEIINYRCSECELGDTNGSTNLYGWDYCRRCGARMFEPQERSDKE